MYQNDVFERAVRKLSRMSSLKEADITAIRALPFRISVAQPGYDIARDRNAAPECCFLLDGFACRHKHARDGGRQILSFHVPGDILDLPGLLFEQTDYDVETITAAELAWVPTDKLRRLAKSRPALNEALWRDTLVDAAIYREWLVNVGQRDAKTRIAHLLCEFAARCEAAGLGRADRFDLPMNQEQIADATGLTSVHVNRMLRELDRDGVILRTQRAVHITDLERMYRIGDFDPDYLHGA